MPTNEKVQEALNLINARFKKPVVFTAEGDMQEQLKIKTISTGCLTLDRALGGGAPLGFAIELYGPEGGAKSTIALSLCAEAQRLGGVAMYVPVENRLNLNWAKMLGVNIDDLIILPTYEKTGEDVLTEIIETLKSKAVMVVVIDSIPGLVTAAFDKKGLDEKTYCGNSSLMTDFVYKIMGSGILRKSDTLLVGINQVREKIGVMFGNPETTPAGRAWKHLCLQRVRTSRGKDITQGDEPIGCEINFQVIKNQLWKPKISGTFELYGEGGIDVYKEVFDLALYYNFLIQRGAYYYFLDPDTGECFQNMQEQEYKWQGQKNVMADLISDEFLFNDLLDRIKDKNSKLKGEL
jgi:recombination protein RecA